MRKFYLLLIVALLATSSAFADITYELNGGQPNPYGWNTKEDMYNAFMTDAGVTGHNTIEYYQSIDKGTELVGTTLSIFLMKITFELMSLRFSMRAP